jgi:hypothetical protein
MTPAAKPAKTAGQPEATAEAGGLLRKPTEAAMPTPAPSADAQSTGRPSAGEEEKDADAEADCEPWKQPALLGLRSRQR